MISAPVARIAVLASFLLASCGGGGGAGEGGGTQASQASTASYAIAAATRQWLQAPTRYDFRTNVPPRGMLLEVAPLPDAAIPALSQDPLARTMLTEFQDGGSRGPFPIWDMVYHYQRSPLRVLASSFPGGTPVAASKVEAMPEVATVGASGSLFTEGRSSPGSTLPANTVTWTLEAADAQAAWLCLHFERHLLVVGTEVGHYCMKIDPTGAISAVTGSKS